MITPEIDVNNICKQHDFIDIKTVHYTVLQKLGWHLSRLGENVCEAIMLD